MSKLDEVRIGMVRMSYSNIYKSGKLMLGFQVNHKSKRLRFEYIGGTP